MAVVDDMKLVRKACECDASGQNNAEFFSWGCRDLTSSSRLMTETAHAREEATLRSGWGGRGGHSARRTR